MIFLTSIYIFDERLGTIEGIQASLTVRQDTNPVYVKAISVAFAVRSAVDKEVDQFVGDGIDFAAPNRSSPVECG